MKEIVTALLLLAAFSFNASDAFQPLRPPSPQDKPVPKVYESSSSNTIDFERISQGSLDLETQNELIYMEQDTSRSNMDVSNVLAPVAASAVLGGLLLTHPNLAGDHQITFHTLQHAAQVWGSHAWKAYEGMLSENPIVTKAATSATVYSIGDVIAQSSEEGDDGLDFLRIARSGLAGGIGHGPLSHFWYNLSEDFFNNVVHLTAWWSFLPKIAIDQTVWGPIWNASYIFLLGLMKQETAKKMFDDAKSSTIPLFLDGLKLWPLAHCVTYGLIPVENRLLWVDLVEILWVSILATKASSLSSQEDAFET